MNIQTATKLTNGKAEVVWRNKVGIWKPRDAIKGWQHYGYYKSIEEAEEFLKTANRSQFFDFKITRSTEVEPVGSVPR